MFKSKLTIGISVIFTVFIFTFPNISTAEIKVYDNNNQYLGILLDIGQGSLTVFIPSINASFSFEQFKLDNPDSCSPNNIIWFETIDCSGTPYVYNTFPAVLDLKCPPYDGNYLPDLNSVKQFSPKSVLTGDFEGNTSCSEYTSQTSLLFYGIKPIQLPFTTPIALPVRFENVANTSDFYVIPVKKK